MKQYLDLVQHVLEDGVHKGDRTGTGTRSVFGHQMRFSQADGFPLVTTKRVHFKSVLHELLWFVSGDTNIRSLQAKGVSIWDEWADEDGELGPVYGSQWRRWRAAGEDGASHIDQLAQVIEDIRRDPDSRRLIVSAWNVGDVPQMKLPPCHMMFQFNVANGRLHCGMLQRSCDVFLGLPFNIASYSLLLRMVAQVTGLEPGDLVISLGDAHLYENHLEQARTQLGRAPRKLPEVRIDPAVREIDDFRFEHFELEGYDPHPRIAADIAV